MSGSLLIKSRQRAISLNIRLLSAITRNLLAELLSVEGFDLAIYVVRAPEMSRLNEKFLQHQGSTDVITFDYTEPGLAGETTAPLTGLHGEIFVCIDDALVQAREFHTSWQSEMVRYVVHGILHLRGFDDRHAAARRKMKREENRLMKELGRRFALSKVAVNSKLAA